MDSVTLFPKDVPGAVLRDNVRLEDHSVQELKRWLECRSLKKTGSKEELIKRINDCIDNGGIDKIFLGVDQGKWYDIKRNIVQNQSSTINLIRNVVCEESLKWSRFPSRPMPPYFNKGHIFTYIVEENVENENPDVIETDNGSVVTVKPFRRGSQYVDSDHISQLHDAQNNNIYYCKCKCQASFNKQIKHDVLVCLNKVSGAVIKGKCDCKQSSLGKCSHITALLLFLAKYSEEHGNTHVASTSQPCQWGKGSNKRVPGPVTTHVYPLKRYKPIERAEYNPLPADYVRNINMNNFLVNIQHGFRETMFETLFSIEYKDFQFTVDELQILRKQTQIFLNNIKHLISSHPNNFFEIPGSFPQGCQKWIYWRTFFITSSNAHIVCGLKSDQAKKNFLLKNLWLQTKPITTGAMQYGKVNESIARKQYDSFITSSQKIEECGLIVNKLFPFLATSLDGLVRNSNGTVDHIFEIKCPKILENCKTLINFDTFLSKSQLNNFCLTKIFLKKSHPYLSQILVSLLILNVEYCNLLIWNPNGLLTVPVCKKDYLTEIETIKRKTQDFYENVFVPEMFSMRVVRGLVPINLSSLVESTPLVEFIATVIP